MVLRLLLLPVLLALATLALADEPLSPPSVWEVCSPSGVYCATLDPEANRITVRRAGAAGDVLWSTPGWSRVAALADDGDHLMLGCDGMNLIPLDYDSGMPMLTFYRRSEIIAVMRLRDLA